VQGMDVFNDNDEKRQYNILKDDEINKVMLPNKILYSTELNNNKFLFFKLGNVQRKQLQELALKKKELSDENIMLLIKNEKTDILYNQESILFTILGDDNRYKVSLESHDKNLIKLFHMLNGTAIETKNAGVVCRFVEMVLWELVKGVWTEVIKQVKECYSEDMGNPTDTGNTAGSGSTWHHGQGGNSNYDVNKLVK